MKLNSKFLAGLMVLLTLVWFSGCGKTDDAPIDDGSSTETADDGDDHEGHDHEDGDDHEGHDHEDGDDHEGHEDGDDHDGHDHEDGDDHDGHDHEDGDDHDGHDHEDGDSKKDDKLSDAQIKTIETAFAKLSVEDRALAEAQGICPVQVKPLGLMGTPVKVDVDGKSVFICCEGCKGDITKDPAKYLANLDK